MSSDSTSPAVLHIRDFGPDPARPTQDRYFQVLCSLTILACYEADSDDVETDVFIPTQVRFYAGFSLSSDLAPEALIYAWGSFLTSLNLLNELEILLHAYSVQRHPGDLADLPSYQQHCPGVQIPLSSSLASFRSVVAALMTGPRCFIIACGLPLTTLRPRLRRGRRTSFPLPFTSRTASGGRTSRCSLRTFVSGRIFGVTKICSELAVLADDLYFPPSSSRQQSTPATPASGKRKARDRWANRAGPLHSGEESSSCAFGDRW
jgi:hypothetical protein